MPNPVFTHQQFPAIERRVFKAINLGNTLPYESLEQITPALEKTAQKNYNVSGNVGASKYKKFIRKNYDLIKIFTGLKNFSFPGKTLTNEGFANIPNPDLADIIYNVYRCSLQHGQNISEEFELTRSDSFGNGVVLINPNSFGVKMPDTIIWALIAIVILAESNSDIRTVSPYKIYARPQHLMPNGAYMLDIDFWWGQKKHFLDRFQFSTQVPSGQTVSFTPIP